MLGLSMDGTWHFNFEQDAYSVVDYEYNNFTVRKINSREKVIPAWREVLNGLKNSSVNDTAVR